MKIFAAIVILICSVFFLIVIGGGPSVNNQRTGQKSPQTTAQLDAFDAADDVLKRTYDEDAALKILLPLAEQGNPQAQFRVGELYYLSKNQNADALRWFQQAADKGSPGAMYYLGNMYNNGHAVRQNFVEAVKWYILSASQPGPLPKGEMSTLKMAGDNRDGLARRMTATQLATAQKMARDWSTQHNAPAPDPKKTAAKEPEPPKTCSTSGQLKTCTVVEAWGTRTTVTDLRATKRIMTEFGEKLQNIQSVRMVFNDVQADGSMSLLLIGTFMTMVTPKTSPEQKAELLARLGKQPNTPIRAFGWTWSLNSSGPTPGKSVTFEATLASR